MPEKKTYPSDNKFPPNTHEKDLPKNLDWKTDQEQIKAQIPLTTFLYSNDCENYCKNPFDEQNYTKLMEEFQVPRMQHSVNGVNENWAKDDTVLLKPPFVISYDSMAIDTGLGKKPRATVEMVNKLCLLPRFIQILMAHKLNMLLAEVAKDPKVAQTVIYAMKHHVQNHGFSNLGGHGCMPIYDLVHTPVIAESQYQIIMAALYLTEIINATLTTIHDDNSSTEDQVALTSLRQMKISLKKQMEIVEYFINTSDVAK